jgi:alkanesulfonate monooxygenase SsuD/methylene tetrahydromethanopterin reductase-like flavin-dependent oxidoreductase (luciferase family)
VPSPQGKPVFVQAGASPRGRDFAATHADSIVSVANGIEGMKAFRDDIRARAEKLGRNPDDIKVLFCITPTLGETEKEAREKYDRVMMSDNFVTDILVSMSGITEIDFAQFDLDKPLPEKLVTNGESGTLDKFQQWGSGKTLRELATAAAAWCRRWNSSARPTRWPSAWATRWRKWAATASSSRRRPCASAAAMWWK